MSRQPKTKPWTSGAAEQPATAQQIVQTLESHQKRIIDLIGEEPFAVYEFLSSEYSRGRVDENLLFQFVYRSYYRLDNAGLTADFKTQYFQLMERARRSNAIDLRALAAHLYQYKTLRNQNSLQFSFVTKLAATVNPTYPIYDRLVATAMDFPPPDGGKTFPQGLDRYMRFYEWLRSLYSTLLGDSNLLAIIKLLETQYPLAVRIPPAKALDFLLWSAGKLNIRLVPS